jgi:hypothetical protein
MSIGNNIGDNIDNIPKFYNGLAKVLEECNQKIEGFLELQQKEELQEKAKSILNYYNSNLEKLEGKPLNEGYYTVFTSKEEDVDYYLLYQKEGRQLYWDDHTLNNKRLVSFSLVNVGNIALNKLLNYSHFNILSLHKDNTTLRLEEYIKNPRIEKYAIDKYLHIIEENTKFADELKEAAKFVFSSENLSEITEDSQNSSSGGKKTTYKLNGEKVVLLHKNKKVQRSIYVKGNGKTKYCKIDHQYILLSKLKNKIQ